MLGIPSQFPSTGEAALTTPTPSLVILDLDDTLYNYPVANKAGMDQAAAVLGSQLGISKEDWLPIFYEARSEVKGRLGRAASAHSRLLYFKTMLEKLGVGGHLDLALQLENNFWQAFIRAMEPTTGSFEFLEACRSVGVPVVVMTDLTLQIQLRKLIYLNLVTYLHAVIASEEVGEDKPSMRFIEYAQNELSLDVRNVWVIGDDQSKDGLLADACGGEFFHVSGSRSGLESFKTITTRLVGSRQ